jgi:Polyketide cyclase / dehydrase and lipid transport
MLVALTLEKGEDMASIRKEIFVDSPPEAVWDALRDFGAVHERLARGFVVDSQLDGDERVVTFEDGVQARELLVGIDDQARRLAYAIAAGPSGIVHYNGSAQVFAHGESSTRFVWIVDVLPNELAEVIDGRMERGAAAIKQTLESSPALDRA